MILAFVFNASGFLAKCCVDRLSWHASIGHLEFADRHLIS